MSAEDPFEPAGLPGAFGGAGRRTVYHPVTLGERARVARLLQMALPFLRIPMVLDNLGQTIRDAYRDRGGESSFALIGMDGRLVYWDRARHNPALHFYKEYRWRRIQMLCARAADLLAAGGRDADPGAWKEPAPWTAGETEPGAEAPDTSGAEPVIAARSTVALGGVIESVDAATGLLVLRQPAEPWGVTPGLELWERHGAVLPKASEQTRLRLAAVRRWAAESAPRRFQAVASSLVLRNGRVAALDGLKPGDRAGLRFRATRAAMDPVPVDMVFAFGVK